jgi:hypothetical protein
VFPLQLRRVEVTVAGQQPGTLARTSSYSSVCDSEVCTFSILVPLFSNMHFFTLDYTFMLAE